MIVDVTAENHAQIRNPSLARYAAIYLGIYEDFLGQIEATGIEIADHDYDDDITRRRERLRQKGGRFRNTDRSIYLNRLSPACVACQKGVGSATYFISLQCHRDCYYCFNPNQVDYDYYTNHQRDLRRELAQLSAQGHVVNHLALTGGEPLLHKKETYDFFANAARLFPRAHTRLYTTGDHASEEVLRELQKAGLQEIRYSIRMHDLAQGHRHTLQRIAQAREYVPAVMVEMPVLPGTLEEMKELLIELEALQIHSINLLEFCYPLTNAAEFHRRNFKARKRPYKVLYNYWYAGGVPVSGSEPVCLDLLEFALEEDLTIGVHYCSLENKLTGQNYQQNQGRDLPPTHYFSQRDYLLKSAKVFGRDIPQVYNAFRNAGYGEYQNNKQPRYLQFHVSQIEALRHLDIEIGIATSTLEMRDGEQVLRELKVDMTTPQTFDLAADL